MSASTSSSSYRDSSSPGFCFENAPAVVGPRSSVSTGVAAAASSPPRRLVIVGTVIATYWSSGPSYGNPTAVDGRWTAVFLANFHFASVGTNYLDQTQPPSPLLNFWSLAVEEQFYLVYPALFVTLAVLGRKASFRVRLGVGLVVVIAASFTSVPRRTRTPPWPTSPRSRGPGSWPSGLSWPWPRRGSSGPKCSSGVPTWLGLGAIALSAVGFRRRYRLSRFPRGHSGSRDRAGHRRGMAAPKWAAEVGPRARTVPLGGEDLLFALPVALADADHRR